MNSVIVVVVLVNLAFVIAQRPPKEDAPCPKKIAFCQPHVKAVKDTFDQAKDIGLTQAQIKKRCCMLKQSYYDCLTWFNAKVTRCEDEYAVAVENSKIDPRMADFDCPDLVKKFGS